jgi:hypothetical protein
MRGDELREEIARLEHEVVALEATASEGDARLAALSDELEQQEGRVTLTRRALADHRARISERLDELQEVNVVEASQVFEGIMEERERAAMDIAESADGLLQRVEALERLNEAARAAWSEWAALGAGRGEGADRKRAAEIDLQPEVMHDAWARLSTKVRQTLDEQHERDLVEAAARSSGGLAIQDLPGHLQELARQRRSTLMAGRKRGLRRRNAGESDAVAIVDDSEV